MVASALALSLIGIGAVHGLPSGKATERRQTWIWDGTGVFIPGQGEIPICLTDVPLNEQPPCILPPIVGGFEPPKEKREAGASGPVKKRQLIIGDGSSIFIPGQGSIPPCLTEIPISEQPPCFLTPLPGGFLPPQPPKQKRGFVLPPDWATNQKEVIRELERQLITLQNKKHKSKQDLEDIEAIKAALLHIAGITNISAPPGTGSSFVPGKRDTFKLDLNAVGTYADQCPNLEGAEIALQVLMHKDKLTVDERIIMQKLTAFLQGCGIRIISSPDGTFTIIKPSDKRSTIISEFDLAGLQAAYDALLSAIAASGSPPSFEAWLALQQIAGLLEIYGVTVENTVENTLTFTNPKAKRGPDPDPIFSIGPGACDPSSLGGLRAALVALLSAYGHPATAPGHIFLIEEVLVSALQICGQTVPGWSSLVPGKLIPGGPMIPQPTIPGGPMKPSDKVKMKMRLARQTLVADPETLLATLRALEAAYGGYGSDNIPTPVWLTMVNIVTILQAIPGVVVPGWPVLGQGSIVVSP
ncbi:hypothetical protein VTK26DRAFT_5061 [Humicola hyalothermophila]